MQNNKNKLSINRRQLLTSALYGTSGILFSGLNSQSVFANENVKNAISNRFSPFKTYGALSPKLDKTTGLPLLSLPDGFSYVSFGWTGQIMDDGLPTPTDHDGMGVVAVKNQKLTIIRNHELVAQEGPRCTIKGHEYNPNEWGGTSTLIFNPHSGRFEKSKISLGGTIKNCAGGVTNWGSWISCEEVFEKWDSRSDGFNHGYIFEVPAFSPSNAKPIKAAGRFKHEAIAMEPVTNVLYQTEDSSDSGFYKYIEPKSTGVKDKLLDGGELYALVVKGKPRIDLSKGQKVGATFDVDWQLVTDPEGKKGRAIDSAEDAALFSRGEGCWYDNGVVYFVSTDGGEAGLGQVWAYHSKTSQLKLIFESKDSNTVNGPDNITVSPRGGILLCEDGDNNPQRLVGLSPEGSTFEFAKNNISLSLKMLEKVDKKLPGVYKYFWDKLPTDGSEKSFTGKEWAGACFYQDWLFVNIQSPGITFAITGPWNKGIL